MCRDSRLHFTLTGIHLHSPDSKLRRICSLKRPYPCLHMAKTLSPIPTVGLFPAALGAQGSRSRLRFERAFFGLSRRGGHSDTSQPAGSAEIVNPIDRGAV